MRRAAKKDRNHEAIARHLVSLGYRVAETYQLGNGFPDLVVGGVDRRTGLRRVWLVEVKMPGEGLTTHEARFHQAWQGDVHIIESIAAAEQLVGIQPC